MADAKPEGGEEPPLAIDLDGTLHAGDLGYIGTSRLLAKKPWLALSFLFHVARGRLALKHWLAKKVAIDMGALEWNTELIAFAREEADKGRKVLLATAAVEPLARQAAQHLEKEHGLRFTEVIASTGATNLLGNAKAEAIARISGGDGVFDYVGDSPVQDPPVFAKARLSHFVNPTEEMLSSHANQESRVFATKAGKRRGLKRRLLDLAQSKD